MLASTWWLVLHQPRAAADRNKPVVVLTNGGSFESSVVAEKYASWRLPIMPDAVVSSRDALIASLQQRRGFK